MWVTFVSVFTEFYYNSASAFCFVGFCMTLEALVPRPGIELTPLKLETKILPLDPQRNP